MILDTVRDTWSSKTEVGGGNVGDETLGAYFGLG